MRSHEDDADYYKKNNMKMMQIITRIPSIIQDSKHYSEKWAHEDMLEEQRQGNSLLHI